MKPKQSILEAIGNTPLIQLQRLGAETGCTFFAKCEFLNAGGSVKDRIGRRMVEEAEKSGRIKPGDTLIEPTSGNTGIGMAIAAAVRGYRMIITMPEKMSREKQVVLEALGAEIIRTPTEAAWDDPDSHIEVAKDLQKVLPNAHILDQYSNRDNPDAHYYGTGKEIIEQMDSEFDVLVASAGTGGTISGIARRLKEDAPNVHIVGVDPVGSILAGPGTISPYKVEGIGYDFIPDVLDRGLVDEWVRSEDGPSFQTARKLIRQEGLLCGGSSGSAMWAALQVAKQRGPGQRIVVVLPDSVRNYMTKFMDDRWMRENGFEDQGWETSSIGEVLRRTPPHKLLTADGSESVRDAVGRMKDGGVSQLPVLDAGRVVGIVTESDVLGRLLDGTARMEDRVAEVMGRKVVTLHAHEDASKLLELFANNSVGIIVEGDNQLAGILTKMDLVDHLTHHLSSDS